MAKRLAMIVLALLLAAFFGFVGWHKTFASLADLTRYGSWTVHLPEWLGRLVGFSELACAALIALGAALRRVDRFVQPAAVVLAANQFVAAGVHLAHGETAALPQNAVLIALLLGLAALSRSQSQVTKENV